MNQRKIAPLVIMVTMLFAGTIISCSKNTTTAEPQPNPIEKVRVGDIEMAYQVLGQGEPLMLIPGLSATMDEWSPRFLTDLSSRFKALEIERANVLGWSMGGDVALAFAVRHPDQLDRLIVYAGDCGGTQRVFTEEVYRELEMFADPNPDPSEYFPVLFPQAWMESHPDFWKDFENIKETSSPESIRKQSDAYVNWEGVYDQLPRVSRPTLIATGTEDISTPPENAIILAERIPGSWLVRFEGAGHGLMYQYPDEFAAIIIDFIELAKEK